MEESCESPFEQKLTELSELSQAIEYEIGAQALQSMKTFIDIYISHQKQSQDFFMSLCEYQIVPRLFALRNKGLSHLQILETFNLLLANTTKSGHLVYIFSQASLHEFFFDKFTVESEDQEAIEYYVQLLKTIILKLSALENKSMIKLFCNSRYPHFPLLTTLVTLGVDEKHEELVRVTANQCFLLLAQILNQTQIGLEYLCEVQVMVYYHQLISSLFEEEEEQGQELLRFMIDLLLSLRQNTISLIIFMNLLTNHLMFRHGFLPPRILKFILFFYDKMVEDPHFPKELAQEITLVLCRIVCKSIGAGPLNHTYLAAQKNLPIFHIAEKPNLKKFYMYRCKRIEQHLIKQMPLQEDDRQLQFVLEEWMHFNSKNVGLSPLRDMRTKPKSTFSEFFTSREEAMEEYVQSIMTLAGIDKSKIKGPIYKLSYSTDYQTALYLVQLVSLKFQGRIQQMPANKGHSSSQKSMGLYISQEYLIQIYKMAAKLNRNSLESQQRDFKSPHKMLQSQLPRSPQRQPIFTKMKGFSYFIRNVSLEMVNLFCEGLTSKESRPQICELCLISAISSKVNLPEMLSSLQEEKLLEKLKELQVYMTEDIFSEQSFNFVFKYIAKNRQKVLMKRVEKSKEGEPESPKKNFHNKKNRIESNFIQYEVIKRLLCPSVKSLTNFIRQYWQCRFFSQTQGTMYPVTQFLYKTSNSVILEVIANQNYEFSLKLSKEKETSIYPIYRDDCRFDKDNPTLLTFEDHNYLIDLQNQEKAKHFRDDLNRLRKERVQLIMNGILEYLTFSFQSLTASCAMSKKKQRRKSNSQFF